MRANVQLVRLFLATLSVSGSPAPALSQDGAADPPAAVTVVPVDLALADVARTYRSRPWGESVRIGFRPAGAPSERVDHLSVLCDPTTDGSAVRVDLGMLSVWAGAAGDGSKRTRIVAVHARDSSACFVAEDDGPIPLALARQLPPLPLFQIGLAIENGGAGPLQGDLTPYTRGARWDLATLDETLEPAVLTFEGRFDGGSLKLLAEGREPRVRRLEARFESPVDAGAILTIECEPIAPGIPSAWRIDESGKQRVTTVADLRRRPGDVRPGSRLPDLVLQSVDQTEWTSADPFAADPSEPARPSATVAVLLFVREGVDAGAVSPGAPGPAGAADSLRSLADRRRRQRLLGRVEREGDVPLHEFAWSPVVVLATADGATRETVGNLSGLWGAGLLWSSSPQTTINRFSPDADAAAVLFDTERVVVGVIPILESDPPDHVRALLESALRAE